ncbi:MAG: hypothetical protein ACFFCS_25155 [Candidatus Hodarchaeota archaeon]
MPEEEKEEEKKHQSADEIAEIMAANMKANMEDPDFIARHERIVDEAAKKVLAERKLREEDESE